MKVMTFSDARKHFKQVVNSVVDDAEECVIARKGGRAIVVVPLDTWNSMKETLDVLSDPDTARQALEPVDKLGQQRQEFIEVDADRRVTVTLGRHSRYHATEEPDGTQIWTPIGPPVSE